MNMFLYSNLKKKIIKKFQIVQVIQWQKHSPCEGGLAWSKPPSSCLTFFKFHLELAEKGIN